MEVIQDEIQGGVIRVLVVDDEPTIREVLTDFLVLEGFEVLCVQSGEEALRILDQERFDVALFDMKMPGMSGLDVLEQLSGQDRHRRLIKLMMTGYGTVETAIKAMKLGAQDYILKPFKVHEVIHVIHRAIEQRAIEAENIQLREAVRLHEVSEAMSDARSLDEIYDLLIQSARQEVVASAVLVWDAMHRVHGTDDFRVGRRWVSAALDTQQSEAVGKLDLCEVVERHGGALSALSYCVVEGREAHELTGGVLSDERTLSVLVLPLVVKGAPLGYVAIYSFDGRERFTEGRRKMLSVLCGRASAALESSRLYRDLQETFKQTIQALANLLEDKDPYTKGHSERVGKYATLIAEGLGFSEQEVQEVADCALMHDIGKMGIRYEDLNKVEPLTQAEYEMFKSHTTRGKWILEPIAFLRHLIPGVYHHHERWDGKGYPVGLKGEDIPLIARILAIADTYDAMTSHRAYRRALPHDVAIREIEAFSGAQFDPSLVKIFVRVMSEERSGVVSKSQRWNALKEERLKTA